MATLTVNARDYASRALAAARAGYDVGPEIKVEPFDDRNVSTAAGLVKLGSSIAAAQRNRANYQAAAIAAEENANLLRDRTRQEIATLRAQEKYNLGEGRQTGTTRSTEPTWAQREAVRIADERTAIARARAARAGAGHERDLLPRAKAGLQQIDKATERDAAQRAQMELGTSWGPLFARLAAGNPAPEDIKTWIREGINPEDFTHPTDEIGAPSVNQREIMLQAARNTIYQRLLRRHRMAVSGYYTPQRERYQSVIDQGIPGAEGEQEGNDADAILQLLQEAQQKQ